MVWDGMGWYHHTIPVFIGEPTHTLLALPPTKLGVGSVILKSVEQNPNLSNPFRSVSSLGVAQTFINERHTALCMPS